MDNNDCGYRRAQYMVYTDKTLALSYAKSFAIAKLSNQANYLIYLSKALGVRIWRGMLRIYR